MLFTPFTAAQYRGLDRDAFAKRCKEVNDLIDSGDLPEGVTIEMLSDELDMIKAERSLRTRLEAERQEKANAVANGAGAVIATSENPADEQRAMPRPEVQGNGVRETTDVRGFTDSIEYRKALARHILHQECMSSRFIQKALQERAAVDIQADFGNMADTFTNTMASLVAVPNTLSDEIIRELREQALIYPKVNQISVQGSYTMSEADVKITGGWIGDKETTDYQGDYDPEVFGLTWHQLEARHARTFLAEALISDNYKALLAPAFAEFYAEQMDNAVLNGNGTTAPRGILTDVRLFGTDRKGCKIVGGKGVPGDGGGRALIVEVTEEDVDNWRTWAKLPYQSGFNRIYRGRGELILADGTWGNHIEVLRDDNNRPICKYNPLTEGQQTVVAGLGNVDLVPNYVLPEFDAAADGEVIGIYGNLRNYTMNVQPGMPLTTVSWQDHETNTNKTKLLLACDGRVTDPFGWMFLVKKASA